MNNIDIDRVLFWKSCNERNASTLTQDLERDDIEVQIEGIFLSTF